MKVSIGPYLNWIGPYQIVDGIFFWCKRWADDELSERWDYKLRDKLGDWLSGTWVNDFCQWIYDKRKRKVEVRIDRYDSWSVDHTLSLIIVPLLKQLQETKHGAPLVDDEDVPEKLRSTSAPEKENEYDTDDNHFERWDWVLNEMIWAHTQSTLEDGGDSQFYIQKPEDERKNEWDYIDVDREGLKAFEERKRNGFRLFGKYYQNLWD